MADHIAAAGLDQRMADVDFVLAKVRVEIQRAMRKHRPYASADELWDEVKADDGYTANAFKEAEQIAATAVRYIVDLADRSEPADA